MRLKKELLNFRRALVVGIIVLTVAASTLPILPYGIGLGDGAFALLILLVPAYLFDITFHSAGKVKLAEDISTLLRLFRQGLKPRRCRNSASVKAYYTNEQYDWITDTQFPEKIFHELRRDTLAKKAHTYIACSEVLDLGCGTGLITQVLPGKVTGLDISPWKVERARQHCPQATFLVGDAEDTSPLLADDSFDTVVCTDILEHLEAPDKAVEGVWRVLKPGGLFIGTVPSKHFVWKLRRFLTTADASGEPFHVYYSKKGLRQLLQTFNIIEVSYQCLGLELFFAATKRRN